MPIKLIVNGYYRSGTTFFWNVLKESDSFRNISIFYEPLHPRLHHHLVKEKCDNKPSLLHGRRIWGEYNEIPECDRLKILKNHPNTIGEPFIGNKTKLFDYLDVYNSFGHDIILQTNRLHFFLDNCVDRYNTKVIHIVRNPHDVYSSMYKGSLKGNGKIKSIIKRVFKNKSEFFDLNREFDWVSNRLGKDYNRFFSWKERWKNMSLYDKFVVVYTLSNYYALKCLDARTLIIPYEFITSSPEKASIILHSYLQKSVDLNPSKIINRHDSQQHTFNKKFKKALDKYNLKEEYLFIQDYISREYSIKYM